ncbi:MAG: ABC transporter permease subunit [Halobacteriaceae archaeon]
MRWRLAFRRLGEGVVQAWAVVTLAFWFLRFGVFGQMQSLVSRTSYNYGTKNNELTALFANVRPLDPLWRQYLDYLGAVLTGDFGRSLYFKRPVAQIVAERLPFTVLLVGLALVTAFAASLVAAAASSGVRGERGRLLRAAFCVPAAVPGVASVVLLGYALADAERPVGVTATFAVTRIATLPPRATPGFDLSFAVGLLGNAAVVAAPVALALVGAVLLAGDASVRGARGRPHARRAAIRGVRASRLAVAHVAPQALCSVRALAATALTYVLGVAVLAESLLGYPGLGHYLLGGVLSRDYTLLAGAFLALALAALAAWTSLDLLWLALGPTADPRPVDWRYADPTLVAPHGGPPDGALPSSPDAPRIPLRDRFLGWLFGFTEEELRAGRRP